jgi:hypothetical protein
MEIGWALLFGKEGVCCDKQREQERHESFLYDQAGIKWLVL